MKKLLVVCSLVILACMLSATQVTAFPYIVVEGFADPTVGVQTVNLDGTTTFSQVDYTFQVVDTGTNGAMTQLKLEFEDDVFINPGTVSNYMPLDWTLMPALSYNSADSYYQVSAAWTTPITLGNSLTFSMLNMIIDTDALTDASFWQEGQIWSQSWNAFGPASSVCCILTSDGGSTAPIPEPGTFMLLGTGLAGAVMYARKKKCLINI